MSNEARIHVSTGFSGGISVNLRADSAAELEQLVAEAAVNSPTLARLMTQTGVTLIRTLTQRPDEAQALANVQQTFPGAVQQPVSTVGQPLPQPTVVTQPAQVVANPPTLAYPGNCAHGQRQYKDTQARGKAWRRWECAVPWSKGVTGRCDPINVEG